MSPSASASGVFPASWNDQRLSGTVAGVVDEAVSGVRVVKAFAEEDREFNRLVDRARELYQSRMRTARYNARYASTLQLIPMLGQLGVLAFGGWLALHGRITDRRVLRVRELPRPDRHAGPSRLEHARDHAASRAGAQRVFELLDMQPRVAEAPDAVTGGRSAGRHRARSRELRLHRFTARAARSVAAHRSGERIGLVGASGSGKTTLAFLIARFYDPTSGTVRLDGVDVRELTLNSLRSAASVVFEESFLFLGDDPREHRLRRPGATDAEVEAAARVAEAHEFILGLVARLRHRRRRARLHAVRRPTPTIALARAALADPSVLLLDDATSAIDARTEEAIHISLADKLGTCTTVLIAHRSSTLRLADRVIVLDAGRIVAEGTNAELWQSSALYRELLTGPELVDHRRRTRIQRHHRQERVARHRRR